MTRRDRVIAIEKLRGARHNAALRDTSSPTAGSFTAPRSRRSPSSSCLWVYGEQDARALARLHRVVERRSWRSGRGLCLDPSPCWPGGPHRI